MRKTAINKRSCIMTSSYELCNRRHIFNLCRVIQQRKNFAQQQIAPHGRLFFDDDNSAHIVTTTTPTPNSRTHFQCIFEPIRLSGAGDNFSIDSKAQDIVRNLIIVGDRCLFGVELGHLSETRRIRLSREVHLEHSVLEFPDRARISCVTRRRGSGGAKIQMKFP